MAKKATAEKRYLLGELSESEKDRLEAELFADDSKLVDFELAEDELVDAYVRGELSADERRQFEAKLSNSPRLVERVNFARVFAEKVDSTLDEVSVTNPASGSWLRFFTLHPAWGTTAAAFGLIILAAGVVLFIVGLRLREQSRQLAAERSMLQRQREALDKSSSEQQAGIEQALTEAQRERDRLTEAITSIEESTSPATAVAAFATVFLSPGATRAQGRESTLVVRQETRTAQLKIALERNDYPTYQATIRRVADDKALVRRRGLKARKVNSSDLLVLFVPVSLIPPPHDYTLRVDGITSTGAIEDVEDYSFRVVSKAGQNPRNNPIP